MPPQRGQVRVPADAATAATVGPDPGGAVFVVNKLPGGPRRPGAWTEREASTHSPIEVPDHLGHNWYPRRARKPGVSASCTVTRTVPGDMGSAPLRGVARASVTTAHLASRWGLGLIG